MRTVIVSALLLVAACGESAGPFPVVSHAQLGGSWRFDFTNMIGTMDGELLTCSATNMNFAITQSHGTFAGVQVGDGHLFCTQAGETVADEPVGGETIINGTVSRNNVTFRLGSVEGAHTATVSGSTMTGTARWIFENELTLDGEFQAARQ